MHHEARHSAAVKAALKTIALCILASATFAGNAHADDTQPRVRLSLESTVPACERRDELVASIAARLGYAPFSASAATTMRVRFAQTSSGALTASLSLEREGQDAGERTFESADRSCAELLEAVALTATIAIDPAALDDEEPTITQVPAATQAVDDESPVARENVATEVATAAPMQPSLWSGRVALGGLGAYGIAPTISPGIGLQLELGYGAFALQLGGRYDFGGRANVGSGSVGATLGAADIAACGRIAGFYGCAAGVLGSMRVDARDMPDATSANRMYAALSARVGYDIALTSAWAVRAQLEVGGALTRTRYFAGENEIWRMPPAYGALSLAVAWTFS